MERKIGPDAATFEHNMYVQMQGLICQVAQDVANRTGMPYDELRAEANYWFVVSMRRFDESRGVKFSTFIRKALHNGLISFGQKHRLVPQKGRPPIPVRVYGYLDKNGDYHDILDSLRQEPIPSNYHIKESLQEAGQDVQELVSLCFMGFASSLERLETICVQRLRWDRDRFNEAVNQIKKMMGNWHAESKEYFNVVDW